MGYKYERSTSGRLVIRLTLLYPHEICCMRRLFRKLGNLSQDENFMHLIENIEVLVSKLLSLAMVVVIFAAIFDLGNYLFKNLFTTSEQQLHQVLFTIFGLFLNVLIALEILENITAYLRKHVVQVELVIVTSLIAVARKIIILDLEKVTGLTIIGLAVAVLSLAISYWIIRSSNIRH
jgi:uncharacterized membrane protein (DUF373 family)